MQPRRTSCVALAIVIALLPASTSSATETPAPPTPDPVACQGALDVVSEAELRCVSPAKLTASVGADPVVVDVPARDPAIFAGEMAFGAAVVGAAGGLTLAVTALSPPTSTELQTGLQVGSISALALSGLLAGAAVSFWAFNPTTGALQLPLFEGEPR